MTKEEKALLLTILEEEKFSAEEKVEKVIKAIKDKA